MNFETKHVIRWGIPGWVFLAAIISYFTINDVNQMRNFIFSKDVPIVVASISLFIGAGIILGHLIHQLSMFFGFLIWTNSNKFFKEKYGIDKKIITNQYGNEIQRIYSYRLGNVHAYRALFFSLILSLIVLIILSININFNFNIGILLAVVFILSCIVFTNFLYFQSNLNYFIKSVKSDFS